MTSPEVQRDTPPIAHDLKTGVSVVRNYRPCGGCGGDTLVRVNGQPGHYGHLTPRSAAVSAPAGPDPAAEREPDAVEVSMFALLQESIAASKKRPVLRVATVHRNTAPWSLMSETMRGEHRWRHAESVAGTVRIFDRNGSYPSAMANVPVSARELARTGAIGYNTGHAGIYQLPSFDWEGGPHPLGEIGEQAGPAWWVTTPHLRLCMKLAATGRIPAFPILDSYTGPAVTNLFRQFSSDVSELREQTRGTDGYDEVKRKSSIAIRSLWPKAARSPFWRPDWSLSTRAEAAVRHWVRADQAAAGGATIVKLGSVDEVAFVQPKNARQDWAPEPYKLGAGFGYVKVKATMPAAEWNRGARR